MTAVRSMLKKVYNNYPGRVFMI